MAYAPNILVKACDSQAKNLTTRIIYYIKNKSKKNGNKAKKNELAHFLVKGWLPLKSLDISRNFASRENN